MLKLMDKKIFTILCSSFLFISAYGSMDTLYYKTKPTCIVLPPPGLLDPEVPCLSGVAGEPVLLIISGEPAGDSLGLLLGLALEFTVIPENKDCV